MLLREHTFIILQFLWARNSGMHQRLSQAEITVLAGAIVLTRPPSPLWLLAGLSSSEGNGLRPPFPLAIGLGSLPPGPLQHDSSCLQSTRTETTEQLHQSQSFLTKLCKWHHFFLTPFVRSKSLGPAHAQGEVIQEWGYPDCWEPSFYFL